MFFFKNQKNNILWLMICRWNSDVRCLWRKLPWNTACLICSHVLSRATFTGYWLIICVNLTGLMGAHIAGKTLLLGVPVKVSWRRIAFVSIACVRKTALTNGDWHYAIHCGLRGTKTLRKDKSSLSSWAGTFIFFCLWMSELLTLRPFDLDWITPPVFLVL